MALRIITPTHILVFKSYVYYAKTTIHSNGLLNCTASKRGPSSNACASRRAQCRTRTVGAQYAHKTRYAAEKTGAVVKMDGNERTLVDKRIGARKVITRNIAHLRAFTVVDFHVLPRYHAPYTSARARVIAQNSAYHFTRDMLGLQRPCLLALCILKAQEVTTKGMYRLPHLSTAVASPCQSLRELLVGDCMSKRILIAQPIN